MGNTMHAGMAKASSTTRACDCARMSICTAQYAHAPDSVVVVPGNVAAMDRGMLHARGIVGGNGFIRKLSVTDV